MKILILSAPFCGAETIAYGIANELNYKCIIDPVEPKPTKYWDRPGDINGIWRDWPTEPEQLQGVWFSQFNPSTIPTDTVGKHNVKWHSTLPGNVTEEAYCDAQRVLYDKTICIGTEQIDFVSKKYMAYKNFEPEGENNFYWEHFRRRHECPYDDSMWNDSDRIVIRDSVNWLKQYASDNSLPYILGEDIYEYKSLDAFNEIIRSMGVGLTEHNKTQNHLSEFHNLTRYGDLGPKY